MSNHIDILGPAIIKSSNCDYKFAAFGCGTSLLHKSEICS